MNKDLKIFLIAYAIAFLLFCLIIAAVKGITSLINSYREKKLKDISSNKIKFFIRKKDESITNEKMDLCIHIAHYDDSTKKKSFLV